MTKEVVVTRIGYALSIAVALLFAALLAWRSALGSQVDPLTYYAPDRFVEKADDFIARGYLEADCRDGHPELVVKLDQASSAEREWYEESYLKGDVERFNEDPAGFGWAFAIDGDCRLRGVHPAVHTIELPFHQRLLWLGDILYRGRGADSTLRSALRTLSLGRPEDPPVESKTQVGQNRVPSLGSTSLHFYFPGGKGQPAGRLLHLGDEVVLQNQVRVGRPESTHLLGHRLQVGRWARLESGDWLTFESGDRFTRSSETFVFLGGESKRIASTVQRQNDRYDRRTVDDGLGQIPDPDRSRAYPYLTQVAKTLDRLIALAPEEEAEELAGRFDLQLTIDRELQLTTTRLLRDQAEKLRRSRNLDLPFSAAITVMDGLTGDLLALATYPSDRDLRDIDLGPRARRRALQNQNFILHPIGSAVKPYLFAAAAQAHPELLNFQVAGHAPTRYHPDIFHCRIPLGYQLLEGHWQEWIDFPTALEMSCNRYTVEIMTLALAAQQAREGGREASSALETTVARDSKVSWPSAGRSSGIRLGSQDIDYPPDLSAFFAVGNKVEPTDEFSSVAICATLSNLEESTWRLPLGEITGADTYRGLDPGLKTSVDPTRRELDLGYISNRYDLAPWMPLIKAFSTGPTTASEGMENGEAEQAGAPEGNPSPRTQVDRGLQARTTLQEIAPERVNLALNQVTRIRGDYISLMLGGGTSIWTNVQLAEALSRLVTGRDVKARLADSLPPRGAKASTPEGDSKTEHTLARPLDLNPAVRAAVLGGLRRVVEGGSGTAKKLKDELAALRTANPDSTVILYSKTGSPILEKAIPPAIGTALQELVRRDRLIWTGTTLSADPDDRNAVPWSPKGSGGRQAFINALSQGLAEVGYRRSRWVRSVILQVVDDYAGAIADGADRDELEAPFRIAADELVVDRQDILFRSQRIKSKGGVYHFALVKIPGKNRPMPLHATDLLDPKTKITVVSIHLEAGEGSEDAVNLAEVLLQELPF